MASSSSLSPPLPPLAIPQGHPMTVTRSLGASHPEGASLQASGSAGMAGSPSTSAATPSSGAAPSSTSSLFLFDNTTSSPLSPSFPAPSSRLSRSSHYRHHRSRSDSVSSTGSSSAGGNCVRRPTLSATSAFFSSSFATSFPMVPPPAAGPPPISPPLPSGPFYARTPSPPPPMMRRSSLRSRRPSGGSLTSSPRLTPSAGVGGLTEDGGFLFMGSVLPRAGSPSPLGSPNPMMRRNSEDGGSSTGRGGGGRDGWEEPTIMEEDEGNGSGSGSGSARSSKHPSKEELRKQQHFNLATPVLSIKPPSSEDTLSGSAIFSPFPTATSPLASALLVDGDPDVLRRTALSPGPASKRDSGGAGKDDARSRKVEERAAALEKRLDRLLLEMATVDDEGERRLANEDVDFVDDEGIKSLGFGAVIFGGGGTSPMPSNKQLEDIDDDEDDDDDDAVDEDGEDLDAGAGESQDLPILYEPRHRVDWDRPRGILLLRLPSADPTTSSTLSSRRPSSTLQLSRASSRSCSCPTCAGPPVVVGGGGGALGGSSPTGTSASIEKSASEDSSRGSSFEHVSSPHWGSSEEEGGAERRGREGDGDGGERGSTAQTSPTLSEGKKDLSVGGQVEWEDKDGLASGKVRFCEAAAEEIITWHAASYDRKGPAPVAKLTMRDVLELREIKEELGIAVDLHLNLAGGGGGGGVGLLPPSHHHHHGHKPVAGGGGPTTAVASSPGSGTAALPFRTAAYKSPSAVVTPDFTTSGSTSSTSAAGSSESSRAPTPSPTLPGFRAAAAANNADKGRQRMWGGGGSLWC